MRVLTPPYEDGDEISEGLIYRRIPNIAGYFDPGAGLPTFLAFTPRERDKGALSAHLKDYVTEEEAATNPRNPQDKTFGLCVLDIAEIRAATNGGVTTRYHRTTGPLGHAHVRVYGCGDEALAHQVALLARVIRIPGASARGTHTGG